MGGEPLPVTVIIPCFNDGETLPDAVESALRSDVAEVIIVSDGCTDGRTLALLHRYANTGVTVLNIAHSGVAAARTCALKRVTTPYVFNLDADDEVILGGLVRLYDALRWDASCEAAWGDMYVFGEANHVVETADCIDAWQLTLVNDLPVSALFRTEALRRVGGWQAQGYEDWDLWMGFADHGFRGKREPYPVMRYRIRPSASMRMRYRDSLRHDALMSHIRSRHPGLFDDRARAWLRSRVPWRVRLVLPVVSLIPVSGRRRAWMLWRANQIAYGRFSSRLAGAPATGGRPGG